MARGDTPRPRTGQPMDRGEKNTALERGDLNSRISAVLEGKGISGRNIRNIESLKDVPYGDCEGWRVETDVIDEKDIPQFSRGHEGAIDNFEIGGIPLKEGLRYDPNSLLKREDLSDDILNNIREWKKNPSNVYVVYHLLRHNFTSESAWISWKVRGVMNPLDEVKQIDDTEIMLAGSILGRIQEIELQEIEYAKGIRHRKDLKELDPVAIIQGFFRHERRDMEQLFHSRRPLVEAIGRLQGQSDRILFSQAGEGQFNKAETAIMQEYGDSLVSRVRKSLEQWYKGGDSLKIRRSES